VAPWREAQSAEPEIAEGFLLLRCVACGSARTAGPPLPAAHETGAYGPGSPLAERLAAPILAAFDRRRLALVRRTVAPPADLLDAGAGRGRFVAAAARAGYSARGIEPARRGAETGGAAVQRVGIEDAAIERGSLDAITLWHVLEHLEDPGAGVARLAQWLRPGGVLVVGAPNLAGLQARLGGARWFHLDVPRHRSHFTARGLTVLLERQGLEVVAVHHVLAEHNPYGMWQTLVNRWTRTPSYLYNLLKRNAPARSTDLTITLLALPLLPVAALLELVAGWARRGGTVAVVAQRPTD
jgi:SAM-dependent methyltransferase